MNHKENIARTGLSIQGVFSDGTGPSFGYTIGLTETFDAPELLMFGLPLPAYGMMFNEIAEKMRAGERFKDGHVFDDLANLPCMVKDISLDEAKKYAFQCLYHYEGAEKQPRFQMIVLPDREGRFPWQEGFDGTLMDKMQPALWKSAGRWKVEMAIGNDWENVWTTGETRKRKNSAGHTYTESIKLKFEGWYEAKAELDEHFAEMTAQGMDFDPDEYRIVPVVPH